MNFPEDEQEKTVTPGPEDNSTTEIGEENLSEVKLETEAVSRKSEVETKTVKATDLLIQNQQKKVHDPEEILLNQEKWSNLTEEPREATEKFNQFPDYFYAGFWMRLWAYSFDLICIFFVREILFSLIKFVVPIHPIMETVFSLIIYLSYFILLTKLNQGQTLGKLVFGLKVVCFNETELSWSTVLVREGAGRFVLQLSLFWLTYVIAAFTGKKQHLADLFADTSVVTLNQLKAYQGLAQ